MRPYMVLAVAMVGSAMKNPSGQPLAIRRRVNINAASVLPAPVTSSIRWICGPLCSGVCVADCCSGEGVAIQEKSAPNGMVSALGAGSTPLAASAVAAWPLA